MPDRALDAAFFVVHTAWIVFICTGWAWRRTQPWHAAAVALTAVSWFGFGAWYGWGYCPLTDWHWQVRARLGYVDPPSYVQLLVRVVTGVELTAGVADALAVITLVAAAVAAAAGLRRRGAISLGRAGKSP